MSTLGQKSEARNRTSAADRRDGDGGRERAPSTKRTARDRKKAVDQAAEKAGGALAAAADDAENPAAAIAKDVSDQPSEAPPAAADGGERALATERDAAKGDVAAGDPSARSKTAFAEKAADAGAAAPLTPPPRPARSPDAVREVVRGYPNMSYSQGCALFDFITERKLGRVLELGFNWGVSSCYAAAAIERLGHGRLVSVDLESRASFDPGIDGFLRALGLRERAIVFYERQSYTWRLRAMLRMEPRPEFDLVFLDGAHLFEPDGLAFILAEKLLAPGGFLVFDDLNWTLSRSESLRDEAWVRALPPDIRGTPHVREVFDLLVRGHPNIDRVWENSGWGFAHKKKPHELDPEAVVFKALEDAASAQYHNIRQTAAVHLAPSVARSETDDATPGRRAGD